jgi:hypothetical protein
MVIPCVRKVATLQRLHCLVAPGWGQRADKGPMASAADDICKPPIAGSPVATLSRSWKTEFLPARKAWFTPLHRQK